MNNDDNFIRNSGDLSSELEARVVAWVLGEASAFEAAQLEMLCAEQPELAVFKRRIEAVHGLMGEAAKPMKAPLRLSPERRAKVLAVIGGEESVAGVPAGQAQPSPARPAVRPLLAIPSSFTHNSQITLGGIHACFQVQACFQIQEFSSRIDARNCTLDFDVACGSQGLHARAGASLHRRCVPALRSPDSERRCCHGLHGQQKVAAFAGLPGVLQA